MNRPNGVLMVAVVATLLVLISFTLPLIGLAETAASIGAGPSARAWLLSSMSLGLCIALLPAGALADAFGRPRVFLVGTGVFALASGASVLAVEPVGFVLARIGQGIGGAAVLAASLALIGQTFPAGPARNRATGFWGAALGAGVASGPILAGALSRAGHWRYSYAVVAVAAVVLVGIGRAVLPPSVTAQGSSRAQGSSGDRGSFGVRGSFGFRRFFSFQGSPVDVGGMVLLAVGVAGLQWVLIRGRAGEVDSTTIGLGLASIATLLALIWWERRIAHPMVEPSFFRRPDFVAATMAALATGLGIISSMSIFATFLHQGYGLDAWSAALLMLLWAGPSVLASLAARRLFIRISGDLALIIGLVGVAVGQALLWPVTAATPYAAMAPGLLVAGIAYGVVNAAVSRQAVGTVPATSAAMGSGINNTFRYLGSALGTTVTVVLLTSSGTSRTAAFGGWHRAVAVTIAFSVLGAVVVAVTMRVRAVQLRRCRFKSSMASS